MTDIAELSHEPVSVEESKRDSSSPPVEQQIRKRPKTRGRRSRTMDAKSLDRLVRFIVVSHRTAKPRPSASAEQNEISSKTNQKEPNLDDLVHVHVIGSAVFGEDRDHARKIMHEILSHPALQPLDEAAKIVASTYLYQAHSAYRLKTDGKYWVLGDMGEAYPYPLAIRTSVFPSWKSQIRSLEKLSKKLRKSASRALHLEANTLVSSHPEQMPAELIFEAETALRKAVRWMEAFPSPVNLRSQYRQIVRPNTAESVGVVAYLLDRLYREHASEPSLKVKEIECRIAELNTAS